MASISKRGSTWQYTVSRTVEGKYKPIRKGGYRTKKEASIAAAKIEADLASGSLPFVKNTAFTAYFKDWFTIYKRDVSQITLNSYKAVYIKLFDHFKEMPIQQITKRDYQVFLNNLGLIAARDTNRKLNGYLRSCVKEAIDEGIIKTDFTRNATITGKNSKKSSEKFLNYVDSKTLLHYLFKNIEQGLENYMLILALTSGMRYGELIGLCEKDFNFRNNTIKINKQWRYKENGGFGPLKNENSERTISLNKNTMVYFNNFIKTREKDSKNVHNLVFYDCLSDISVIKNDRLNDVLKAILKRLDITPLITVHGLRHTHASILLYQEISVLYVSERLGHASIDITSSTYAHVLKELRDRDSQKTNKIFENLMN
ncbi:tyrosine-type recombinase/integrase [Lysinibacillus fusiformis]|uniref:tyrosine-type recombinase/integrase n=1 Tax=Lysinibacillus fusiformis TaxID=28031 RepID=UPI00355880CA